MLAMILHRPRGVHFYRVEITDTLFGEYLVLREWGRRGRRAGRRQNGFSTLRDAVTAADRWQKRARRRGYALTEERFAA